MAEDNNFTPKAEKAISLEERIFLASLVCNLRYVELWLRSCWKTEPLTVPCELLSFTGQRILTFSDEHQKSQTARTQTLQGSATNPGKVTGSYQDFSLCGFSVPYQHYVLCVNFFTAVSLSGCLSSPHQELDCFVLTLVQRDGIQGSMYCNHDVSLQTIQGELKRLLFRQSLTFMQFLCIFLFLFFS